jgi:transcriptional regulator with XRE-family HTH domain
MISRIEREEARPTASLLGKISSAFGLPLSDFFASVETQDSRIARAGTRRPWRDPQTGYVRTPISSSADRLLQLIDVKLPAGARVRYPAGAYEFIHQQIWVLEGVLTFSEGDQRHELATGDCLTLGPPADCTFANTTRKKCRYLVAVVRR